jgi:hypothetical protein
LSGRNEKLIRKATDEAATATANAAGAGLMKVIEYARQIELKAEGLEAAVSALETRVEALASVIAEEVDG